jgi:hypothetical protein
MENQRWGWGQAAEIEGQEDREEEKVERRRREVSHWT